MILEIWGEKDSVNFDMDPGSALKKNIQDSITFKQIKNIQNVFYFNFLLSYAET